MIDQMTDDEDLVADNLEQGVSEPSFYKWIKKPGIVILLLGFVGAGAHLVGFNGVDQSSAGRPSGPPPAPVVVASATKVTMAPHTILPGTVISKRDAVIASEATGKVLSVALVGDIVKLGDSLAEIDPQNATQLVSQRKAALARISSLYQYHKDYFARVNLEESKLGIPEIGVAELRSNMKTAKADMQAAQAALRSAELELERTSIKAPFAGRVVSQSIQIGEYAQLGSPMVRLVDTDNLEVSAQVPASLVQPIQVGSRLEVSGMGKTIRTPMRALVPVGDSISRTMELRVELTNSGLLVGSAVRVSLPSAQPKEVVAVPRDAVILRTNSQYVFVVDPNGVASRRDIELGFAEGEMIEAIGDISADDIVIVRGGERLRDGQTVSWDGNNLASQSSAALSASN